jgi:hypothetical protein
MAEIRIVGEDGNVSTPSSPQAITHSPIDIGLPDNYMEHLAISQVLGLENDKDRSQYKDYLEKISEWAKLDDGYKDMTGLKWKIQTLQNRLGSPDLTEKWVTKLGTWVALELQERKIQAQQRSLMNGFDNSIGE